MNNQTENSNTQTIIIQKGKDATIAYLLWIIFGTLGAHRFYLGRFRSAIAQLILTIVGSIFAIILIGYILLIPVFIWWLFDGYLTYQMVSQENEKVNSTNTTITGTIKRIK